MSQSKLTLHFRNYILSRYFIITIIVSVGIIYFINWHLIYKFCGSFFDLLSYQICVQNLTTTDDMENIINLHHNIFFIVLIIIPIIIQMLISLFINNIFFKAIQKVFKTPLLFQHNDYLKIMLAIIPCIILGLIALTLFTLLLFVLKDCSEIFDLTMPTSDNQWCWIYTPSYVLLHEQIGAILQNFVSINTSSIDCSAWESSSDIFYRTWCFNNFYNISAKTDLIVEGLHSRISQLPETEIFYIQSKIVDSEDDVSVVEPVIMETHYNLVDNYDDYEYEPPVNRELTPEEKELVKKCLRGDLNYVKGDPSNFLKSHSDLIFWSGMIIVWVLSLGTFIYVYAYE